MSFPAPSPWCWLAGLLGIALCAGCQKGPAVDAVAQRFPEVVAPAGSLAEAAVYAAFRNEIRPILAREREIFAGRVDVERDEVQRFEIREVFGLEPPLAGLTAFVQRGDGVWKTRRARLVGPCWRRRVAVEFTAADVGRGLSLRIAGRVPPGPLDVSADAFEVQSGARLLFAFGVTPGSGSEATVRVSAGEGTAGVLYEKRLDLTDAASRRGWIDVDQSLQALPAGTVRLRFEGRVTASDGAGDEPTARIFVTAPAVTVRSPVRPPHNLVLVSIDTLRADHLGAYGYPRPVSPTIDHLAQEGTLFENVFAPWPETSASHMTVFTGVTPSVHGVGVTAWHTRALPTSLSTLAERLSAAGFYNGAVTEDGILLPAVGFRRGFDTYQEFGPDVKTGPALAPHPVDGMVVTARAHGEAAAVFAAGARWVRRHSARRFFLFLHTYQVHQRAAPGRAYDEMRAGFTADGLEPAIDAPESILATYAASVAYTDDQLRDFLDALRELSLTDRTLVVVTSDHGEEFFEHGLFGHNQTLYDPAVRVPLILYGPGVVPMGRRIETQAGLIDLMPTLLDLLGLQAPGGIQGRSLAPLLRGEEIEPRSLVLELADRWTALRTSDLKLIRIAGKSDVRWELYDLVEDPAERTPLPLGERPEAEIAQAELRRHEGAAEALRALALGGLDTGSEAAADIDAETRARLRALGYEIPAPAAD